MKKLLLIVSLCFVSNLPGQQVIPTLKTKASTIAELIPKEWNLLDTAIGDLNQDGFKDLVMVLQGTNKEYIQYRDDNYPMIDTNRRILAIYFADSLGNYYKHFQDANFILLKDDEFIEDPFFDLVITDKGVIKIEFNYWTSMGTWETSHEKFLFRYNKQRTKFELIGYYYSWFMRNSFEGEDYSVNFLTRKMSVTENSMLDEIAKPKWIKFDLDELKTLEEIVLPGSWKFMDLYI